MKDGEILDERYQLVCEIDSGGTSIVYLAKDLQLNRHWAIKCLSIEKNNVFDDAFQKEVDLLSKLEHPLIPRIVQYIKTPTHVCLVMDYINGISLKKKLEKEGVQREEDVTRWAIGLCEILHYLHTAKEYPIIYCDLKPNNIMISNNQPKLIDFGTAKMCKPDCKYEGQPIGTEGYSAPEMYRKGSNILTPATDIYSLGATLYKSLTGIAPEINKPYEKISKYNTSVTEEMEQIIYKCLNRDPKLRYQTMNEVKKELIKHQKICNVPRLRVIKQIAMTATSFLLAIMFTTISLYGNRMIDTEAAAVYQQHFERAVQNEESMNYQVAIDEYAIALQGQNDEEGFKHLYDLMIQEQGIEAALDLFEVKFPVEEIAKNTEFSVGLIQDAMTTNKVIYKDYIQSLIEALEDTGDEGTNKTELRMLEYVIADEENQDNQEFMNKVMNNFEEIKCNSNLTPNQQLSYYYSVVLFLNAFSEEINDEDLENVAEQCAILSESQIGNNDTEFDKCSMLLEMIANTYNNKAVLSDTDDNNYYDKAKYYSDISNALEAGKG